MVYRLAVHRLFVVLLLGSCSIWPSTGALAQGVLPSEPIWAQRISVIARRDEGNDSRSLSTMSRTLLETAEIATNQIERPRDKASRLIELSRAYAQFNEQEKAIELFDQALFVILEIPDENLRLFELYSYGLSLASIVPIDDLEASIDRRFAFAEGQLTTEEVQQVKISAIAASYGYAGEYDRAIELSNEIEAPQIQRLTQELIRQTALRETGDTAWIRGSSDRNPFSEEIAVPSPSARLVELSFDVFRQQNDPLFDFEANVAERLEIISDLPHPAERARAYTDISRHLAERGRIFELSLSGIDAGSQRRSERARILSLGLEPRARANKHRTYSDSSRLSGKRAGANSIN